MSKIIFLGSGSAFTVGANNWQSDVLIEADSGEKLLLDCGTDIRFSMFERGLKALDIDAVYVSHTHADHVGGLEWLAFSTKFVPGAKRPVLFVADSLTSSPA